MITYETAKSDQDLQAILNLQAKNLPINISPEEAKAQGFVTLQHDFDLLKKMNHPYGHIIAKDGDEVVAYALTMLRTWKDEIPLLVPMFENIDKINYGGVLLQDAKYFTMGQVCVAKSQRGKGVFKGLYEKMKTEMEGEFDYLITEIAARNLRSLRAHAKVGFEEIKRHTPEGDEEWVIVLWKF